MCACFCLLRGCVVDPGDDVDVLTVTGNDALTELDMTGLADSGTALSATVKVYDNDLTAAKATNSSDGETDKADGNASDAGSFDDGTSGMDTLKVYLAMVDGDSDNNVQVNFDTVSVEDDTETAGTTTTTLNVIGATTLTTTTNEATVLKMVSGSANTAAGAKAAIGQIYGMIITPAVVTAATTAGTAQGTLQITMSNIAVFDTTTTGTGTALALTGNSAQDIAAIESTVNLTRATAIGVTMDAKRGANSTAAITLREHGSGNTAAVIGERYTTATAAAAGVSATNHGFGVDDIITVTVGSNSVTATAATASVTAIGSAIYTAWAAKYHSSGTASAAAVATMDSPTFATSGNTQALAWTMNQEDSGGYGKTIAVSVTAGGTGSSNGSNANSIDWTIGASNITSNNTTVDDGISTILTFTANDILVAVPALTTAVSAAASMVANRLETTKTTNTGWANGNLHTGALEPITDTRSMEAAVGAATSNAVAATIFTRVSWLG